MNTNTESRSRRRIRAALKAKGYTVRKMLYQRPRYRHVFDFGWWVAIDPVPRNGESPIVCFTLPEVLREIAELPNIAGQTAAPKTET